MFDFYVQKMVMVGCGRHYHPYKIYGRTRRRENTDPRRLGKEVYYLSEDLLRILQGQGGLHTEYHYFDMEFSSILVFHFR